MGFPVIISKIKAKIILGAFPFSPASQDLTVRFVEFPVAATGISLTEIVASIEH